MMIFSILGRNVEYAGGFDPTIQTPSALKRALIDER